MAAPTMRSSTRSPRQAGVCAANQLRDVELNYDTAVVTTGLVLRGYRRNGSNVVWPASFSLNLPQGTDGPAALQKDILVVPGGAYYQVTSSGLVRKGDLLPLDAANGAGGAYEVLFRDSLLLTTEWTEGHRTVPRLNAWVPNAAGGFDQAAVLSSEMAGGDFDISHNTVVAANSDYFGYGYVTVINIPTPVQAPRPYANNFETSDISAFDQPGTPRFTAYSPDLRNTVLRYSQYAQSHGYALLRDSDWPLTQSVSTRLWNFADRALVPQNSWAGVALRHTDASNAYVAGVSGTLVATIAAIVNGQKTVLAREQLASFPEGGQLLFQIVGDQLYFKPANGPPLTATDSRLKTGRAGLVSFATYAYFDDVVIAPTTGFNILYRGYFGDLTNGGPLTQLGGTWVVPGDGGGPLQQTNTTQQALYFGGTPTHDQVVSTEMRLDQFGSTNPVSWIGLIARYVDTRTFYYLSVRSTGQLQIRKTVNGVTTVLAAKPYVATAGEYHRYKFEVVGGELRAYVDDALIASVKDSEIPSGKYGVGSYRAAASWKSVAVSQP